MKLADLVDGQDVALVRAFAGLPVGSKGTVLGYSSSRQKAFIQFYNQQSTKEYIPLTHFIGVVEYVADTED